MQVAGIPPLIQQTLLTVLGRVDAASTPAGLLAVTDDAAASRAPTTAMQPSTSVQMLVALAATETDRDRRRRVARSTEQGLAALEALYQASLEAPLPLERLEALRGWAQDYAAPDEPRLLALARDIELRVRVELAKHDIRV